MNELILNAKKYGIPYFVVMDAGRTQIEAGSLTVCAIGPWDEQVNEVTGNLSLL